MPTFCAPWPGKTNAIICWFEFWSVARSSSRGRAVAVVAVELDCAETVEQPLADTRAVIATALRTAFADERPWPMIAQAVRRR